MINKKTNFWYVSSFAVSIFVAIPILTVFSSFFSSSSEYIELLKTTFLKDYIINSATILLGVLFLTFIFGVLSAYFVSFYNFWGVNFFKWALILFNTLSPGFKKAIEMCIMPSLDPKSGKISISGFAVTL